jgi:hypothetical protein
MRSRPVQPRDHTPPRAARSHTKLDMQVAAFVPEENAKQVADADEHFDNAL